MNPLAESLPDLVLELGFRAQTFESAEEFLAVDDAPANASSTARRCITATT
jgi:hypothetical protein